MATEASRRFEAARRIFLAVLEQGEALPGPEREAFVAQSCGADAELLREVQTLLEAERAADPRLEVPAMAGVLSALAGEPERIGEFRILGVLGSGGMGVVYEAEQANPRRSVALKVIRSPFVSPDELRRFEHEGRALAWLSHPGIASIHAAGVADTGHGPQPYLAMELVRGERIDLHAEHARLGLRARLELLAKLCDAVHHAHQKGVIHRDLKPGNVLVGADGQPKILDFGVARLTTGDGEASTRHTSAGQILGTLPYMSPEQVRADPAQVDLRSDVYALGVIAYELLARKRPLEVSSRELPEAIRAITHDEPTQLGLLDRRLRGEVETIVHKAMAKEKERRYGSAAELAADLRRYLASEPILARPASRAYQLRKFARRNRALVGGIAAVFLALVAGTITSTVLYLEKEDQRAAATRRGEELARALEDAQQNLERAQEAESLAHTEEGRARTEAETAQAVTDYLVTLFEHANPEQSDGRALTAQEMLDEGVERIRDELQDQPAIRGRLLNVFGKIDNWLQRYDRSRPLLEEALELTAQEFGADSAPYADTLERLAQTYLEAGDVPTAEEMQRRVLALREKHLGKQHKLYADALNNLANSLQSRGAFDGAAKLLEEARAIDIELEGVDSPGAASTDYNLGVLYTFVGRYREGAELLRHALAVNQARNGKDHWRTLFCHCALADCLRSDDSGNRLRSEALEHATTAYQGLLRLFGPQNLMVSRSLRIYASCLREAGRAEEAIGLLEDLLARSEELALGAGDRTHLLVVLGRTLQDSGRSEEAESLYLEALEQGSTEGVPGEDDIETARHNLSVLYAASGRLEEALSLELEAVARREKALGLAHPNARGSLNNLAAIYHDLGRTEDELATRRRKLRAVEEAFGHDAWEGKRAREELAHCLGEAGREEEATALLAQ